MTAPAMTLIEHERWLPPGKRAAVCFSIDDVHPAISVLHRKTDNFEDSGFTHAGRSPQPPGPKPSQAELCNQARGEMKAHGAGIHHRLNLLGPRRLGWVPDN